MSELLKKLLAAKRDHSDYVIHFTKCRYKFNKVKKEPTDEFDVGYRLVKEKTQTALEVLATIAKEGLKGSSNLIKSKDKCICFTETPLHEAMRLMSHDWWDTRRYEPYGIAVRKDWLFSRSGRPVIYQSKSEASNLIQGKNLHLHVSYKPGTSCDFTWEREWRIKTEKLEIDSAMIFIVPTIFEAEEFKKIVSKDLQVVSMELL